MDLTEFREENDKNIIISSIIPRRTKIEKCVLGIDEAGRGPVLGPMVYAVAYCPLSCLKKLKEMEFADSKTLTEKQREELFENLNSNNDFIGWNLEIISPNTISNKMLQRSKYNLNEISHDSAIGLIRKVVNDGVNALEVYVDTVGVAEKYQSKLSEIFPDLTITVSKQADAIYPIVSAASICAKVARDRAVREWKFKEKLDPSTCEDIQYGSGYPNDPVTKKFLAEHLEPIFGYPQLVRFSWATAEKILKEKAIRMEWSDEEDDNPSNTPSVLQYFKNKKRITKKCKNHIFFKDRCLTQVTDL